MRRRDPLSILLTSELDLARPFTTKMAIAAGLSHDQVTHILRAGLIHRPIKGVLHSAHLDDSPELRVACLRLVVPPDAVVTDRTAGWLHGAPMVLAPGDHEVIPRVSVFQPPGRRLRNGCSTSGERQLAGRDIVSVDGLKVTTRLRTACDLGRLLRGASALAGLDAMLRLGGFSEEELLAEIERFRGFRGVRQLRAYAPLADPGAESYGESALRLRWYEAGVQARPETQIEVWSAVDGRHARVDLGCREVRYGAEYDGEAFHGDDRAAHDRSRRTWLRAQGWRIDVFRRENVFGQRPDVHDRLLAGFGQAVIADAVGARSCAGSRRLTDEDAPGRRT